MLTDDARHAIHRAQDDLDLAIEVLGRDAPARASLAVDRAIAELREARAALVAHVSQPESAIEAYQRESR